MGNPNDGHRGLGRGRKRPEHCAHAAPVPVEKKLPKFDYRLDESDPDVVVLRRQDGAFVAAFSARGITQEGVVEAAEEDYGALLEAHASSLGLQESEDEARSA